MNNGYSLEDILEEARRIRRENAAKNPQSTAETERPAPHVNIPQSGTVKSTEKAEPTRRKTPAQDTPPAKSAPTHEDILEEVRRIRRENAAKNPQSTAAETERPAQHVNIPQGGTVKSAEKDAPTRRPAPAQDTPPVKSAPTHEDILEEARRIRRENAAKNPQSTAAETERPTPQVNIPQSGTVKSAEKAEPTRRKTPAQDTPPAKNAPAPTPKTGIRRLDRFLMTGGEHAWDGKAASHIAPHALTPEELMGTPGEDAESVRRRVLRRAALDGMFESDSTAESGRKAKKRTPGYNSGEDASSDNKATDTAEKTTEWKKASVRAAGTPKDTYAPPSKTPAPQEETVHFGRDGVSADKPRRPHGESGRDLYSDSRQNAHGERDAHGANRVILPRIMPDYSLPLDGSVDDYETTDDARRVRLYLDRKKGGLTFRTVVTLILFLAAAAMSVFDYFGYPFSGITPKIYLITNAAVLLLAVIVNITDIVGIFKIFAFRADASSASGLAVVAALADTAVRFFTDAQVTGGYQLYTSAALLAMLFTVMAKNADISRIRANFELIANVDEKIAAFTMDDEYAELLAGDDSLGGTVICTGKKTVNVRGFLQNSFDNGRTDMFSRVLVTAAASVALIGALAMGAVTGSVQSAVTVFAAVAVISAPLSVSLLTSMQLGSASKKLREEYGVLTGRGAVEQYKDVDELMLDSTDLFPLGSVHLNSIKNFGAVSVDKAILAAAAVAVECGGTLAELFDSVIEGRRSILPSVSSVRYESGRGMVGVVDGDEVKIGSRAMMDHYAVPVPSAEAERKITRRGMRALYLSVGKELAAIFIVSYDIDEDIAYYLGKLADRGVNLIVHTRDPLISESMITESFRLPAGAVRVLSDNMGEIYRAVSAPAESYASSVIGRGSVASLCHSLLCCFKINGNLRFGRAAQVISAAAAVAAVLFAAFAYGLSAFGGIHLLIYQLVWAIIIIGGAQTRGV